MKKVTLYRVLTLAVLFSLLAGACQCTAWPPWAETTPGPTPPPYTPPPRGNVSPVVIQRTPERGQELPPDGVIQLVFDRSMNRSSVEAALLVGPDVSGTVEWINDRTVSYEPDRALERDTEYHVTLGQEATAADGDSLDGAYRFRFRTVGYLEVTQVIPAPDTEDAEAASTITAMFNRPVVPLTAVSDPDYAGLPQPLTFDPAIDGSGEWLNTSIYVFTPDEPLAGGTTYTARISAGLEDTTGGVLADDYEWSFSTQPPQVVWGAPGEDQDLVSVDTAVHVTFNVPVDPDSAAEAFELRAGGEQVAGTATVDGATLVFTPTGRLPFDVTCRGQVDAGVQGVGGGEGMRRAYEWTFATVPLPRILDTIPRDGEQNAWPWTSFDITFNAPIDPETVMPNLEMTPPLSPTGVFTYFNTWNNTFVLDFGARPSTDYEVRISGGIADPYGNTTGQDLTVRFRTAPLEPRADIRVPGIVGTLDAHAPARVVVSALNTTRLDLDLYRVDLDEFFRARAAWWDYEPGGSPMRTWSVPIEAPLNETTITLVDLVEGGGTLAPGVYVLNVNAPGVRYERWVHRKLLVVSDYNVTLKTNTEEVWAWVTDMATGRPVEGLALSVRDHEGVEVGSATTGGDGLAHTAFRAKTDIALVSEEPFVLGMTAWEWSQGISAGDFGLDTGPGRPGLRAHVYTDRPLYRAGQTVHFRGVIRNEDDVVYSLPGERSVEVSIYDAVGEEIYRQTLSLDEYGSFNADLDLDEGASLGDYYINASFETDSFGASFQVAAYRPPEFEVLVTPEESELAAGESTRAEVEVRYLFGAPVADVDVEWNVLSAPYRFEPSQFGRYDFTDEDDPWICFWCWWWAPPAPQVILSGSGTTDAGGRLAVLLPTTVMTGGQQLTIEATAFGRDGQVISGRSDVVVHAGDFYVGLAPQQYIGEAGEESAVDVVTVDWAGERLSDQDLDVEVYRREWVNTYVENEFGGGSWEWETDDTLVHVGTLATDSNAEGVAAFTPEEGGSYRVVVSGRDSNERLVRSSTWLWVSGTEYVSWRRENNDRITLVSDKPAYVPGETAEILIPSPFAGEQWAWITVERGGVLYQEVLQLESNSTVYRLPITAGHAPNVYFSVTIFKGPGGSEPVATHKVGYVLLTVEPVKQVLDVTLTSGVEQAEPGDTVSFDLVARDSDGEPVEAAFSLDLVDKAVLSLSPRTPDAIVEAFYGERGLGVATFSGLTISINRLLEEQMEQIEQLVAADVLGRGLGGGGGGMDEAEEAPAEPMGIPAPGYAAPAMAEGAAAPLPPGVELREEFQDTAYWDATIVTDASGRATVEIELPDNLTTWVVRGVGTTVDTLVGEETEELLVTKPLLVRPVTPRFFVVGDRAQLAALVSNNTGETQEVEVTLHAEGLQTDESASQQVSIPDGSEAEVTWWVVVEDVESADAVMSAVAGVYSDAARPRLTTGPDGTLLVRRYVAPEIVGTGGQLVGEDSRTESIALPPRYDDRQGELSVQVDPSLAAGMTDGLDYLEHFPYECTEQVVSRFLPNVLTYRALRELDLYDDELEKKLPGLVEEGLGKLYLRQHGDGGWGWWHEGESNPHLTAYVVFALVKAEEAGLDVRGSVLRRGLTYLESVLVSAREIDSYREANRQAFVLYVLAEAGETSAAGEHVGDLYGRRDKLHHYGRAFVALALGLIDEDDARIDTLLSDLQNAAILSATGAHWEEPDYDWWAMNTDTRSTAVILDALARLDPENALIPNVVRWLMVARRDGIWETTQETAWALIALTDWMVVTGELEGEYNYAVWLNDGMLADGSVTPDTVRESQRLQVPVADLLADANNALTISRGPGVGRLYYTAHLEVHLPVEEIEPLDRGIIVSRRYVDPACTERGKCEELSEAGAGDVVQVQLTIIAPHDLYYIVVEDPLPAGAEAIDPGLETTSLLEQGPSLYREAEEGWYGFYYWWWRWYSRSEVRDDRVVLFADYVPAGTYEYTYTFRATLPGEYRVIPTTAHEFYFPEVFGRADGRLFTIVD